MNHNDRDKIIHSEEWKGDTPFREFRLVLKDKGVSFLECWVEKKYIKIDISDKELRTMAYGILRYMGEGW